MIQKKIRDNHLVDDPQASRPADSGLPAVDGGGGAGGARAAGAAGAAGAAAALHQIRHHSNIDDLKSHGCQAIKKCLLSKEKRQPFWGTVGTALGGAPISNDSKS